MLRSPEDQLFHYVRADYENEMTIVPKTMSLMLENRETGATVQFTFENQDAGDAEGIEQRNQAVTFLSAQGCAAD